MRCGSGAAAAVFFCALGSVSWERFCRMDSIILLGFCFGRKALNAGASRRRLRVGGFQPQNSLQTNGIYRRSSDAQLGRLPPVFLQ